MADHFTTPAPGPQPPTFEQLRQLEKLVLSGRLKWRTMTSPLLPEGTVVMFDPSYLPSLSSDGPTTEYLQRLLLDEGD